MSTIIVSCQLLQRIIITTTLITIIFTSFYRERLLAEHPNASHLTSSIMRLFVGMELTGHGVQFENKFRYRQPMYIMFKHLWKMDIHKRALMVGVNDDDDDDDSG